MCEKRGMCTSRRQVPLLVVTTLLVGVRPEIVGEYRKRFVFLCPRRDGTADHRARVLRPCALPSVSVSANKD